VKRGHERGAARVAECQDALQGPHGSMSGQAAVLQGPRTGEHRRRAGRGHGSLKLPSPQHKSGPGARGPMDGCKAFRGWGRGGRRYADARSLGACAFDTASGDSCGGDSCGGGATRDYAVADDPSRREERGGGGKESEGTGRAGREEREGWMEGRKENGKATPPSLSHCPTLTISGGGCPVSVAVARVRRPPPETIVRHAARPANAPRRVRAEGGLHRPTRVGAPHPVISPVNSRRVNPTPPNIDSRRQPPPTPCARPASHNLQHAAATTLHAGSQQHLVYDGPRLAGAPRPPRPPPAPPAIAYSMAGRTRGSPRGPPGTLQRKVMPPAPCARRLRSSTSRMPGPRAGAVSGTPRRRWAGRRPRQAASARMRGGQGARHVRLKGQGAPAVLPLLPRCASGRASTAPMPRFEGATSDARTRNTSSRVSRRESRSTPPRGIDILRCRRSTPPAWLTEHAPPPPPHRARPSSPHRHTTSALGAGTAMGAGTAHSRAALQAPARERARPICGAGAARAH
jgi:hypothetical protein